MRYYSDMLNEFYETEEQCKEAESDAIKNLEAPEESPCDDCTEGKCSECNKIETPEAEQQEKKDLTKKDLADKVQRCEEKLKEAYELYSVAEQKASDLSKKYLKEIDEILSPAKKAVKDAEAAKYQAIKDFNDSYGVYRVSYTGARAAEELKRSLKQFEDTRKWVDSFFNWF